MSNESERKHDAISALRDLVMLQLSEAMPSFDLIPICDFIDGNEQERLIVENGGKAVLITFEEASSEALKSLIKRQTEARNLPLPAFLN